MDIELLKKRFMGHVDKQESVGPDACWLWIGSRVGGPQGYGAIRVGNRSMRAHRVSFELFNGPIPQGKEVCHKCDNPPCIRPDHLFAGSRMDNMRDKISKGRHVVGRADPDIKAEITRRIWAGYSPEDRAKRVGAVSDALKGKPFTLPHLLNLRSSPANRKGRPARASGFSLPQTRLSVEQISEIRTKYAQGMRQIDLALEYGVSHSAISKVVLGSSHKGGGPVSRQAGYGTGRQSEVAEHGNTGKKRTEEQRQRMSAARKALWASGAYANRKPRNESEASDHA